MRILAIEDDMHDMRVIRNYIGEVFCLEDARTLTDGIARLQDQSLEKIDLVLLDLRLPDSCGGVETIKKIKPFAGGIPIVAYTGGDFDLASIIDAGARIIMQKPAEGRRHMIDLIFTAIAHEKMAVLIHGMDEECEIMAENARNSKQRIETVLQKSNSGSRSKT